MVYNFGIALFSVMKTIPFLQRVKIALGKSEIVTEQNLDEYNRFGVGVPTGLKWEEAWQPVGKNKTAFTIHVSACYNNTPNMKRRT